MELGQALRRFYFGMTLNELRLMNENKVYPNISYNSLLYLDLIGNQEQCTVSCLADALHISKPAVTLKVNELMAQGLVKKTRSKEDRRINYLSVTEVVREDYRGYDRRLSNAVRSVREQYSKEEIRTFIAMLDEIGKEYNKTP